MSQDWRGGPFGLFNVAKCVEYLRNVGVEVTPAQEAEWQNTEKVHRYLRNESRIIVEEGLAFECCAGHRWFAVVNRRSTKSRKAAQTCPQCGQGWGYQCRAWARARNGAIVYDGRPADSRWRDLADGNWWSDSPFLNGEQPA